MTTHAARADTGWVEGFAEGYAAWFKDARPLIEAHQHPAAFKTYPVPALAGVPWTPLTTLLPSVRLGVVTTAGLYRTGVDAPFADTAEGDPRVVELPREVDAASLDVSHSHIPQDLVRQDVNIVLPLEHLRALEGDGRLGRLAPRFSAWSVTGPEPTRSQRKRRRRSPPP